MKQARINALITQASQDCTSKKKMRQPWILIDLRISVDEGGQFVSSRTPVRGLCGHFAARNPHTVEETQQSTLQYVD
jgi:hypothetical protein